MRKTDLKLSKSCLSHLSKPSGVATSSSRSSTIPLSLDFGGATVLSIHPSRSILSEKALATLKYAFLQNKKVGISSSSDALKPKDEDLERAVAAYEIAQELVAWSEQIEIDEDPSLECEDGQIDFDVQKPDCQPNVSEDDHRSQDLKDKSFARDAKDSEVEDYLSPIDAKGYLSPIDAKDYLSPIDAKNESLLEIFSDDCRSGGVDGKTLVTSFLDCEGMDFFASGSQDEQDDDSHSTLNRLGESDIFPVDIDVAFGIPSLPRSDSHVADTGDDSLELDLLSPISSPSSPSTLSPNSPGLSPP